jgi:hypothetical protein
MRGCAADKNFETLALAVFFEHKCSKVPANARVVVLYLVTIKIGEYFTNTLSPTSLPSRERGLTSLSSCGG